MVVGVIRGEAGSNRERSGVRDRRSREESRERKAR